MSKRVSEAWNIHHETKGRLDVALEMAHDLESRKLALRYVEEAAEAFAELEGHLIRTGSSPESLEGMHDAFYKYAHSALCLLTDGRVAGPETQADDPEYLSRKDDEHE